MVINLKWKNEETGDIDSLEVNEDNFKHYVNGELWSQGSVSILHNDQFTTIFTIKDEVGITQHIMLNKCFKTLSTSSSEGSTIIEAFEEIEVIEDNVEA